MSILGEVLPKVLPNEPCSLNYSYRLHFEEALTACI